MHACAKARAPCALSRYAESGERGGGVRVASVGGVGRAADGDAMSEHTRRVCGEALACENGTIGARGRRRERDARGDE